MPEGSKVSRSPADRAGRTLQRVLPVAVPVWFGVVDWVRLSHLISLGPPGYDGLVYRDAAIRWLQGGDPWQPVVTGAQFAAPPPSLLAMLPFALVPPEVAVALLMGLGLLGTAWALRRLGMPAWWLLFPPLVDGWWIANPHILVLPLLVAGHGAIATLVKVYALPPLVVLLRLREVVIAMTFLLVSAVVLPWGQFIARFDEISAVLRSQAGGTGLSVLSTPVLIPMAIVAAVIVGRRRAAWWLVPVFWPYTQFYYSSLLIPGATMLGGVVASIPVEPAATLGLVAVAVELVARSWLRRRPPQGTPATT
jgi:hypothetical protein